MTLRENIRRALRAVCNADILCHYNHAAKSNRGCRPGFARLQNLLAALVKGEQFTMKNIASATNRSTKTVQRDLDFLREQGIRLRYIPNEFRWQLEPGQQHPWLQLKGVA